MVQAMLNDNKTFFRNRLHAKATNVGPILETKSILNDRCESLFQHFLGKEKRVV